jgi:hypothetical protein
MEKNYRKYLVAIMLFCFISSCSDEVTVTDKQLDEVTEQPLIAVDEIPTTQITTIETIVPKEIIKDIEPIKPEFMECNIQDKPTDIADIQSRGETVQVIETHYLTLEKTCPSPLISLSEKPRQVLSNIPLYLAIKEHYCEIDGYAVRKFLDSNEFKSCALEYDALIEDIKETETERQQSILNAVPKEKQSSGLFIELGENLNDYIKQGDVFHKFNGSNGQGSAEFPVTQWIQLSEPTEKKYNITDINLKLGIDEDGYINQYTIQNRIRGITYNQLQKECVNRVNTLFPKDKYGEVSGFEPPKYDKTRAFFDSQNTYQVDCDYSSVSITILVTRSKPIKENTQLIKHLALLQYVDNMYLDEESAVAPLLEKAILEKKHRDIIIVTEKYIWDVIDVCPSPLKYILKYPNSPRVFDIAYKSDDIKEQVKLIEDKNLKKRSSVITNICISELQNIKQQLTTKIEEAKASYLSSMDKTKLISFNLFGYPSGKKISTEQKLISTRVSYEDLIEYRVSNPTVNSIIKTQGKNIATIYLVEGDITVYQEKLLIDFTRSSGQFRQCREFIQDFDKELSQLGFYSNTKKNVTDTIRYLSHSQEVTVWCSPRKIELISVPRSNEVYDFYEQVVSQITKNN